MRLRVVWGLSETMATFSPTRRLTSVDFPAFGRPTTATSPTCIPLRPAVRGRLSAVRVPLPGRRRSRGHGRALERLHADPMDAPPVRLLHGEEEIVLPVRLARFRDVAETRREEAGDGRELLLLRPAPEELLD